MNPGSSAPVPAPTLFPTNPPTSGTVPPVIDNHIIYSNQTEKTISGIFFGICGLILIITLGLTYSRSRKANNSLGSYINSSIFVIYFISISVAGIVMSLTSLIIESTADLSDKPDGPNALYDYRQWEVLVFAFITLSISLFFFYKLIHWESFNVDAVTWFVVFAFNALLVAGSVFFTIYGFVKITDETLRQPLWVIVGGFLVVLGIVLLSFKRWGAGGLTFAIGGIILGVALGNDGILTSTNPDFYVDSYNVHTSEDGFSCNAMLVNKTRVRWIKNSARIRFSVNLNELRGDTDLLQCDPWSISYDSTNQRFVLDYSGNVIAVNLGDDIIEQPPTTEPPVAAPTHQPSTPAPTSAPLPPQKFVRLTFDVNTNGVSGTVLFYANERVDESTTNVIYFKNIILPSEWGSIVTNPSYQSLKNVFICQSDTDSFSDIPSGYQFLSILAISVIVFFTIMSFIDSDARRAVFGTTFIPLDFTKPKKTKGQKEYLTDKLLRR